MQKLVKDQLNGVKMWGPTMLWAPPDFKVEGSGSSAHAWVIWALNVLIM